MALTEPSAGGRIVEFVALSVKVTLIRACIVGDVLGVAEDNFDDMGPIFADKDAHATAITYLPRLIAAQSGEADAVITAYGAAFVTGYTSAVPQKKIYVAGTSGAIGEISETVKSGTGSCGSVIGMSLFTNKVLLHPMFDAPPDTITTV